MQNARSLYLRAAAGDAMTWRVDSLYTGKWNHTCPGGERTAHEFGDVCDGERHPSLPIEPPPHPYECGADFVCIHCGQIGSYAHTYPPEPVV